jgi:hypothetical protein
VAAEMPPDAPAWPQRAWWKLDVVAAAWAQDARPFIWIDDDISRAWPLVQNFVGGDDGPKVQGLFISPDFKEGLVPRHFSHINEWLEYPCFSFFPL